MLPIKSVFYVVADVNLVHNLVSILLKGCCENHYLVIFGHLFDELDTSWTNQEKAFCSIFNVVDKGFIQIKNKGVKGILFNRIEGVQEWRVHLRQIGEVVWKNSALGGGN